jgi:hypothetical protein
MQRPEKFKCRGQTGRDLEPLLACRRRLRADRLSHHPDRRQGTTRRILLPELHRSQSEAEAVFAFQRGARGKIRGKAL